MASNDAEIDRLFADCDEGVNDSVTYQRAGQSPRTFDARVNHNDKTDQFAGNQVTAQDIAIEVRKALVPVVAVTDRIQLPHLGKWFNPREWKNSTSGLSWIIYVKVER